MSTPQPLAGSAEDAASPHAQRCLDWFKGPARPWHHVIFAAALAGMILAACLTGAVPARGHPSDMLFFVDGAWRTLSGQRPHVDFVSTWGPFTYLALAAGFKLAGGTLDGVGYANALVGLMLGIWAYWILLKRTPAWVAVFGGAMLTALTVSPVSLGYSFELTSQAMFYNRHGFALTAIVIIECFPLRESQRERGFWDGVSSGAACALLFFLKASYFGVAAVLIALSLVWLGRLESKRAAGIAAGFAVCALPMLAYVHFDLRAMFSDLRMAAHARSRPLSLMPLAHLFFQNISTLVILAALAAVAGVSGSGATSLFHRWKNVALVAIVFTGGILLLSTNAQPERVPLNETMALLLAGVILSGVLRLPAPASLSLAAVALGLLVYPVSNDFLGVLDGVKLKHRHPKTEAYVAHVRGFEPYVMLDEYANTDSPNTGRFIKPYMEDGVELLKRESKPGEKVTTFDAYNPFSYALGTVPPSGGLIAAVFDVIFNEQYHPSADLFFGDADLVMFPRTAVEYKVYSDGLYRVYGAELTRRFSIAAESPRWVLYRRKR